VLSALSDGMRVHHISQKDLVVLYSIASVYCQPSFYEGFGLPVLEAMACGCPVVCSKKGSLTEVAGEAALYIDKPDKISSIKKALKKGLNLSKSQRSKQVKAGLKQAKKFSWQKTGEKTIDVYKKVLRRPAEA